MQKRASGVLLNVTEPSEFIVVKEEAYRDALGAKDRLAGKVHESEFKGLTIQHVMEQRVDHPAFAAFRNAPEALLGKISSAVRLRKCPPRKALGKSNSMYTLVVHGSVSLHLGKRKEKDAFHHVGNPFALNSPDPPLPRVSQIERISLESEVENRGVRR